MNVKVPYGNIVVHKTLVFVDNIFLGRSKVVKLPLWIARYYIG